MEEIREAGERESGSELARARALIGCQQHEGIFLFAPSATGGFTGDSGNLRPTKELV